MEHYFVITGKIRDENGAVHKTYGLALWKNGGILQRIEDISTNKRRAKLMASCMNRYRVAAIHFYGIVEDMLACEAPNAPEAKKGSAATVRRKQVADAF